VATLAALILGYFGWQLGNTRAKLEAQLTEARTKQVAIDKENEDQRRRVTDTLGRLEASMLETQRQAQALREEASRLQTAFIGQQRDLGSQLERASWAQTEAQQAKEGADKAKEEVTRALSVSHDAAAKADKTEAQVADFARTLQDNVATELFRVGVTETIYLRHGQHTRVALPAAGRPTVGSGRSYRLDVREETFGHRSRIKWWVTLPETDGPCEGVEAEMIAPEANKDLPTQRYPIKWTPYELKVEYIYINQGLLMKQFVVLKIAVNRDVSPGSLPDSCPLEKNLPAFLRLANSM
jgi:hypothetical protein